MKIEYDVKIPTGNRGPYADLFWSFYESDHTSASMQYDTKDEAKRAYRNYANIIYYNKIKNVYASKRGNVVYLIRSEVNGSK